MPETLVATPIPLTTLTEDEILFRNNVRQFAEDKIRPLVKEMDEKAVFDPGLLEQFFQLGLMGIEIPEQYGGAGGTFFEAILAVEEFSRVDASAGVIVDVQNTLVANAIIRWGLCAERGGIGLGCICVADARGVKGQRVCAQRAQALDHERQGSRHLHSVCDSGRVEGVQGHYGVFD